MHSSNVGGLSLRPPVVWSSRSSGNRGRKPTRGVRAPCGAVALDYCLPSHPSSLEGGPLSLGPQAMVILLVSSPPMRRHSVPGGIEESARMFLLVLSGRVADPVETRVRWEAWQREVAPRTPGWLGDTGGISESGEFVALVRFQTEGTAARAFTPRDDAAWWHDFAGLFVEGISIDGASEIDAFARGDFEDAGCVQFIRGQTSQVAEVRELNAAIQAKVREACPDIIADVVAWHGDGRFTEAVYFISEEEARRAEKSRPSHLRELSDRWATRVSDERFVGAIDPMHASPRRLIDLREKPGDELSAIVEVVPPARDEIPERSLAADLVQLLLGLDVAQRIV